MPRHHHTFRKKIPYFNIPNRTKLLPTPNSSSPSYSHSSKPRHQQTDIHKHTKTHPYTHSTHITTTSPTTLTTLPTFIHPTAAPITSNSSPSFVKSKYIYIARESPSPKLHIPQHRNDELLLKLQHPSLPGPQSKPSLSPSLSPSRSRPPSTTNCGHAPWGLQAHAPPARSLGHARVQDRGARQTWSCYSINGSVRVWAGVSGGYRKGTRAKGKEE